MLETNVRVDHAVSSVRIIFVLRVPHALVQFVTDPVLVLVTYSLTALGGFACLANNQEIFRVRVRVRLCLAREG